MSDLTPAVTIVDGQPRVSSIDIAEKFEKQHADVLKAIRKLLADLPKEFTEGNFSLSEFTDPTGRKLPMYHLTRDAFSLLAMGFTGKKALAWKVKYIEAFNGMEAELLKTAKKRVERNGVRKIGGRKKAIPEKQTTLAGEGMEAMKKLMRLRADVFEVSLEVQNALAKPFWNCNEGWKAESMKVFANELHDSTGSFFMAINNNMLAVEHMFRAYIEAEKFVVHQ